MTASIDGKPARHVALGPHALARRVPCSICRADTGTACQDHDGTERNDPHHSRWIRYQHLTRRRPFTAVVRESVDEHVHIGDVLLCVATAEARTLRVLADGLGHRHRGGPEFIDARAVEFRAFIEENARMAPRRTQRRPQLGATA